MAVTCRETWSRRALVVRDGERDRVGPGRGVAVRRRLVGRALAVAELPAPRGHAAVAVGARVGEVTGELVALPIEGGRGRLVAGGRGRDGRERGRERIGPLDQTRLAGLESHLLAEQHPRLGATLLVGGGSSGHDLRAVAGGHEHELHGDPGDRVAGGTGHLHHDRRGEKLPHPSLLTVAIHDANRRGGVVIRQDEIATATAGQQASGQHRSQQAAGGRGPRVSHSLEEPGRNHGAGLTERWSGRQP